jgi:hypothetical protein
MMPRQSRRAFMKATGLAAATTPLGSSLAVAAPAVLRSRTARPVVIASANGNFHKNGGSKTCVELAFERMVAGTDILELREYEADLSEGPGHSGRSALIGMVARRR